MTALGPVLLAAAYALGVARVRRWPRGRSAAFGAGLVTLLVAGGMPEGRPAAHMAEHMLMCLVAAPLLVAGAPLMLALRALHGRARQTLAAVLRRVRVIGHPVLGCAALSAALLVVHLTPLYDATGLAHAAEHVALMGAALWFWGPLLSREVGTAARIAAVLALMAPMGAVGAILMSTQRGAAVVMWVGGGLVLSVALVLVAGHALWQEERRMRRREAV
jgi:putative membrane protein